MLWQRGHCVTVHPPVTTYSDKLVTLFHGTPVEQLFDICGHKPFKLGNGPIEMKKNIMWKDSALVHVCSDIMPFELDSATPNHLN